MILVNRIDFQPNKFIQIYINLLAIKNPFE